VILDLAATESCRAKADVCIVGAGIAGLLLAVKLRSHGLSVVVLESGSYQQTEDTHPLNRVIEIGAPYRGGLHGRARCLGGTSTRWGGALIPLLSEDTLPRPHVGLEGWPVQIDELAVYLPEIEALFGIDKGPFDNDFIKWIEADREIPSGDTDFIARFAKWPTFRRRNLATLFGNNIKRDQDLKVWLNATVRELIVQDSGNRLESVVAASPSGSKLVIHADRIVLCGGAIESTRLLLLLDRSHDGCVFRHCNVLGRYFFDHITLRAADIVTDNVFRLNRMAGIRFVGQTMRSLRYELSPQAQRNERVGSAFGHISFETESLSGFDSLRDFLRVVQRVGRVRPELT